MPVATIVGMVAEGMSEEEILKDFPYLEKEDITQALRFAAATLQQREMPTIKQQS